MRQQKADGAVIHDHIMIAGIPGGDSNGRSSPSSSSSTTTLLLLLQEILAFCEANVATFADEEELGASFDRRGLVEAEKLATEEDHVRDLFRTWGDALATGDPRAVSRLYTKNATLLDDSADASDVALSSSDAGSPKTGREGIQRYYTRFMEMHPRGRLVRRNLVLGDRWAQESGVCQFTRMMPSPPLGLVGADDDAAAVGGRAITDNKAAAAGTTTTDRFKVRYTFLYTQDELSGVWKIRHHHLTGMMAMAMMPLPPGGGPRQTHAAAAPLMSLSSAAAAATGAASVPWLLQPERATASHSKAGVASSPSDGGVWAEQQPSLRRTSSVKKSLAASSA